MAGDGLPSVEPTPTAVSKDVHTPDVVARVVPTPTPVAPKDQAIFPEPWEFEDGTALGEFGITPYQVFTNYGVVQLGLIREVSPKHVKALQELIGGSGFTGAGLRPALSHKAISLEAKKKLKPRLARESKKVQATKGSMYFDGEGTLLFLVERTEVPKSWNFVGQVILDQNLVTEVLSKTPKMSSVKVSRVEGLAI